LQSREAPKSEPKVNLEEIRSSGALFQTEVPIRPFTSVWFAVVGYGFRGRVIARALYTGLGYFTEMRFHPSYLWSELEYLPKHLFSPVVLHIIADAVDILDFLQSGRLPWSLVGNGGDVPGEAYSTR
jgi:hypothetical protein